MSNYQKDIIEKTKIKMSALENSGVMGMQSDELRENVNRNFGGADSCRIQHDFVDLGGNKLKVFIKRCMRKLIRFFFGWYIKPMTERQSHFNDSILDATMTIWGSIDDRCSELERRMDNYINIRNDYCRILNELEQIKERNNYSCDPTLIKKYSHLDYFDFEDSFRGSRDEIKERQRQYLQYFERTGGGEVVDIGCGRGEFLELMFDKGISSYGVDLNSDFVAYCQDRGFRVIKTDIITHLESLENCSLGGLFMGQVVEHLNSDYVIALINLAYLKLKPGCHFIIETQNPETLSTYLNFYIDMDHMKPVHYLSLEYLFKAAAYQHVERISCEYSRYPLNLSIENQNADDVNRINNVLFGERDYAIAARK